MDPPSSNSFTPWRLCVRVLFATLFLSTAGSIEAQNSDTDQSLRRACEFLWSQQAADGGWHSEQYAVLRSGQSLTPFVLHSLLNVPESVCPRREDNVARALDFLRQHVDNRGAIGAADPDLLEYPVYSTAYGLQCLLIAGRSDDLELAARMRNYLLVAQRSELFGFTRSHVAYGGWGFDWPKQNEPGHMDIAHTRRALQALAAFERRWPNLQPSPFTYKVRARAAEEFLRVLQRHPAAKASQPRPLHDKLSDGTPPYDGGFYFSPVVLDANKGRTAMTADGSVYFRSYATATCDGLLALLAAGVDRADERVCRAAEWLRQHDELTYPQGVPRDQVEPWGEAIRFYHFAVRAEALAAIGWPGDWRTRLSGAVQSHQAPDGGFRNEQSPLMKEDDSSLCTTLAIVALTHCQTGHPAKTAE